MNTEIFQPQIGKYLGVLNHFINNFYIIILQLHLFAIINNFELAISIMYTPRK